MMFCQSDASIAKTCHMTAYTATVAAAEAHLPKGATQYAAAAARTE